MSRLATALAAKSKAGEKPAAARKAAGEAEAVKPVPPGAAAAALAEDLQSALPAALVGVGILGVCLLLAWRPQSGPAVQWPEPESQGDAQAQEYLW